MPLTKLHVPLEGQSDESISLCLKAEEEKRMRVAIKLKPDPRQCKFAIFISPLNSGEVLSNIVEFVSLEMTFFGVVQSFSLIYQSRT